MDKSIYRGVAEVDVETDCEFEEVQKQFAQESEDDNPLLYFYKMSKAIKANCTVTLTLFEDQSRKVEAIIRFKETEKKES